MFNIYLPLLHEPLFLAAIAEGLHLRDYDLGCVVLLVCALGARFCDDPRVLLEEEEEEPVADGNEDEDMEDGEGKKPKVRRTGWHSAGWKYFRQVKMCRREFGTPVTVFDLQIACVRECAGESTVQTDKYIIFSS